MKYIFYYMVLTSLAFSQNTLLDKANSGDHSAATMVGIYYKNGENGFEQNVDLAKKYFELADQNGRQSGNFLGAFMLGILEYKNNPDKSIEIWTKMRTDHEEYKNKFRNQVNNSEIIKNQKEILSELELIKKQNKILKRRVIDDMEDGAFQEK